MPLLQFSVIMTVIGLAIKNGSQWTLDKIIKQKESITEMIMIKWICGITRDDKIMNKYIGGSIGIAPINGKTKIIDLRRM